MHTRKSEMNIGKLDDISYQNLGEISHTRRHDRVPDFDLQTSSD